MGIYPENLWSWGTCNNLSPCQFSGLKPSILSWDYAKAAFTMGFTYQLVAFLPIIGIAGGVLTMAGQNFGAKNYGRIKSISNRSLIFTMSLMAGFALIFISGSETFVRVFSRTREVIAVGRTLLQRS